MKIRRISLIAGALALLAGRLPAQMEEPYHPYSKWTFDAGGGMTSVVGSLSDKLDGGYNFQIGGGYNFTPRFGLMMEFMNNHLGISDDVLRQYSVPDGNASVFAITLNPIWRFSIGRRFGAYLIGGGGYYHRTLEFTQPSVALVPVYDPWWGYYGGSALVPADRILGSHYDDTGGVNAGAGITFAFTPGGLQFFAECRYHHVFTYGQDTQLLPATFGFRF